ncbi:unnamed protein product, partial [Trichogramma brassicae]
ARRGEGKRWWWGLKDACPMLLLLADRQPASSSRCTCRTDRPFVCDIYLSPELDSFSSRLYETLSGPYARGTIDSPKAAAAAATATRVATTMGPTFSSPVYNNEELLQAAAAAAAVLLRITTITPILAYVADYVRCARRTRKTLRRVLLLYWALYTLLYKFSRAHTFPGVAKFLKISRRRTRREAARRFSMTMAPPSLYTYARKHLQSFLAPLANAHVFELPCAAHVAVELYSVAVHVRQVSRTRWSHCVSVSSEPCAMFNSRDNWRDAAAAAEEAAHPDYSFSPRRLKRRKASKDIERERARRRKKGAVPNPRLYVYARTCMQDSLGYATRAHSSSQAIENTRTQQGPMRVRERERKKETKERRDDDGFIKSDFRIRHAAAAASHQQRKKLGPENRYSILRGVLCIHIARDLLDGNLLLRTFYWRIGKTPCGQQWVSRRRRRRVSLPCAREESQRYARARPAYLRKREESGERADVRRKIIARECDAAEAVAAAAATAARGEKLSRQGSACDAPIHRVPGNDYPWDSVCAWASISSLYVPCVCTRWLYVLRHRRSRVLHMIIAAPQALRYSLCQAHTFPQSYNFNAHSSAQKRKNDFYYSLEADDNDDELFESSTEIKSHLLSQLLRRCDQLDTAESRKTHASFVGCDCSAARHSAGRLSIPGVLKKKILVNSTLNDRGRSCNTFVRTSSRARFIRQGAHHCHFGISRRRTRLEGTAKLPGPSNSSSRRSLVCLAARGSFLSFSLVPLQQQQQRSRAHSQKPDHPSLYCAYIAHDSRELQPEHQRV